MRGEYKTAFAAATLGLALLYALPWIELNIFAQGAARIASLLSGSPVFETPEGWLLPVNAQPILVTTACSGATFFVISYTLLSWQLRRRMPSLLLTLVASLIPTLAFTLMINGLRIVCLAHAHHWIIPHLPASYAAFAHLLVGVAVFLPSLICLNLLLEYNANTNYATAKTIN